MELLIITGMSGAGKSVVVDAVEDLGYFCIDNLPPKLLPTFTQLLGRSSQPYSKVAIVSDIRSGRDFESIFDYLKELKNNGYSYKIFFIDANDTVLVRRYKETRRIHPMLNDYDGSLSESIAKEREKLSGIRGIADYYIDSSNFSASECKARVIQMLTGSTGTKLNVHCMSFGFKYGAPSDCDLVFDVRCLPNPFYVPELKEHTGLEAPVRDYVMQFSETQELLRKFYDLIDFLLPLYIKEGKSQLVIGFGCTGGRHRSVCFAENMYNYLSDNDKLNLTVAHRDIKK
ncbi:MAG: RNase adapter RapZ [Clostridia bacterium]|nr:RNase adapter RapZ [Clostridia bacterium]